MNYIIFLLLQCIPREIDVLAKNAVGHSDDWADVRQSWQTSTMMLVHNDMNNIYRREWHQAHTKYWSSSNEMQDIAMNLDEINKMWWIVLSNYRILEGL